MSKEIETTQQDVDNTVELSGEDESKLEEVLETIDAPKKSVDEIGKEEAQTDQPPELTTDLTPFPKIWEYFGLPENSPEIVRQYLQMKEISTEIIEMIVQNVEQVLAAPIGSHVFEDRLKDIVNLVKEALQIISEENDQPHGSESTGSDESE